MTWTSRSALGLLWTGLACLVLVGCGQRETEPEAPVFDAGPMSDPMASPDPAFRDPAPSIDTAPDVQPGPELEPAPEIEPTPAPDEADEDDEPLSEEEMANIRELPEEDQAIAIAQKICPVSEHNLGSMDVPVKLTLNDEIVFLCCEFCKDDAEADPEATLAKIGKGSE